MIQARIPEFSFESVRQENTAYTIYAIAGSENMFVIIGIAIVITCLLVGYTMHGGNIKVLIQYSEFIIIGGAGLGSVLIGYSLKGLLDMSKEVVSLSKGSPYKKDTFLELLQAMYEYFQIGRKEGLIGLEKHVENPHESEIMQKYPSFKNNHHAVDLFSDTLKLVVMGGIGIYDLSDMMDIDLEAHEEETMKVPGMLNSLADSMPAFGIVAAVLGVVVTMQSIGGPAAIVGEKVAAALIGTFLGVLLAYGLFSPLSKAVEGIKKSEMQYMACIKNAIIPFARGDNPLVCVEFARRSIEGDMRPSFSELEDTCRKRGKSESATQDTAKAA